MIGPGEKLDVGFQVGVVRDGVVKTMAFGDLLTRPTLVSVHMKNRTPSCDRQNDGLAVVTPELQRLGYDVVAVSRDTTGSHERYAAARKLPYALVSDPEDRFAKAARSLVEKSMYGRSFVGPARAAFILARDGTVLEVIEKVDTANVGSQLLAAVGQRGTASSGA